MIKLTQANECAEITHNGSVVAVVYRSEEDEVVIVPNAAERVRVDTIQRVNK